MIAIALFLVVLVPAQPGDLIDRTLAIVSGRTVTLSDARTALALGLVEGRDIDEALIRRLVERELVLREIERYQPPEPSPAEIEAAVAAARTRAGGDAALAGVLAQGGFTPDRLRSWVRDDLRVAAYLQQRFPADDRRVDQIADWVSDLRRRAQITVMNP